MRFEAVIFDWRGTLVTTLSEVEWVARSLAAIGRAAGSRDVRQVLDALQEANGEHNRLDSPGVDSSAEVHRSTYFQVFAEAGLDEELSAALYAVESDHRNNLFATDTARTLNALHEHGIRLAVLSDIHFDVRPAFDDAGVDGLIDVFTLSYEHGCQKPDPALFVGTLAGLGTPAPRTLMVGDRSGPDGPAVEQGITTLLLPPLTSPEDHRLDLVTTLCGIAASSTIPEL
jgi:FMN phosphatase YigB (HAD superfamily)